MKKVRVFEGTINGKKFDNISDFNTYMKKLYDDGCTNVESTSRTYEEFVNDEKVEIPESSTYDTDVYFHPYFDVDDPCYLDILVTENKLTNIEALKEAQRVLENSYKFIIDNLSDTSTDVKIMYLSDIREIIDTIKSDSNSTLETIKKLNYEQESLTEEYQKAMGKITDKLNIMDDAMVIIDNMLSFYRDVENETMLSLNEDLKEKNVTKVLRDLKSSENCSCKNSQCECKNDKSKCTCGENKCSCDNTETPIKTSVKESVPQREIYDFNYLLDRIFGPVSDRRLF